ncbi:hypothetical protein SPHS8_00490 [Sphingobium sp. S8]|nr:hypothetical protein SPHS8_00490 [Sphingobium sp. S8]
MRSYLIQIDGWNGATATPVRLASHDDDRLCHLNGQVWWPAIASLPTLRYDFFDGAFDARSITSPTGSFTAAIGAIPNLPALALHDARVRIWRGELGDAWAAFTLIFDGRVKEQPAIADGMASFSIGTDDSWLDQPLLSTYAGTGGAEGSTDLQGQVKPLALGAPRFAPAVLVDAVDNIYQISAYGAINAVTVAFDRLTRFGAVQANHASFAALDSATVTRGRWATSLAGGYVRLGAPADGMVSFHVEGDAVGGWSRLPGALIARIAAIAGGTAKVASGDIAALNTARPWTLSLMVTAQTTARELIQRIAASVNAVAYVDWLGMLRVAPVGIGAASLTMAADGSALPPVASVEQVAISAPYWRLAQGAVPTWQVHAPGDVAFSVPVNPRGPYDAAATYREGDMVSLPDGSFWRFQGAAPAAGSFPADGNPNWRRLADDITAGNITYEDGTPVEDLKPAEPGATAGATPEQLEQITAPSISLSRPTVTLWAYENGIVTDFSNANGLVKVMSGGVDVTASAALSATATGCTGTINTTTASPVAGQPKGYYRVTAMPGDTAKLTLTAIYGGKTVSAEFQLTKIRAGFEIVTELPTTNLFQDRRVSYNGKLYRYDTAKGWTAAINGADIDNATLTTAKFASGIEPVTLVEGGSLPTTKLTSAIFFDGNLYRWNGSDYVRTVQAGDVTGKIVGTQIDDNSIQTPHLAAGAVIASKMSIIPNNMCADPFFEDMSYWNYRVDQQSAWAYLNETGWASVAMSVPRSINIGGPQTERIHIGTGLQKCDSQGETFWLRAHGRNSTPSDGSGTILRCAVWFYGGDPLAIIGQAQVDFSPGTPNAGEIRSTKFTFPANCIYYRIVAYSGAAWAVTGNLSISAIRLQKAADASLIVEGAVLAEHLAADSVIAGKVAAGTINTRELAAKAATIEKLAIGTASNMIPNSNFETLDGWTTYYAGATVEPYSGTEGAGLRIKKASSTNEAGARMSGFGQGGANKAAYIPVSPGETYRVKCKVTRKAGTNAGNVGLYGDILRNDGSRTGTQIGGITSNTPIGVTQIVSGTYTIPTDVCGMIFQIYYGSVAGSENGDVVVTDMSVSRMSGGELIVDGEVLARHLASEAVTTDKLAAGAVVAGKISVTSLAAISANLGNVAVSGNLLVDGTVNGVKIGNGAVDTGKIATEAVTKSYFAMLASPISSMTINTETQVLSVTLTGVEAGEVLRVTGMIKIQNADDLEGDVGITYSVNGGAAQLMGTWCDYKVDSDGGASTKISMPLFGRLIAPSAGTYVVNLRYYARKSNSSASAGTSLDVMRQRR